MNLLKPLERYLRTDTTYILGTAPWLIAASSIGTVTSLALSIAYARYLPTEYYGTYRYILSVIGVAGILAFPGMGYAITRAVAQKNIGSFFTMSRYIFWGAIGISFVCAILGIWFFSTGSPILAIGFFASIFLVPAAEGLGSWKAFFDGQKRFREKSIINIAGHIANGCIMLILAYTISRFNLPLSYALPLLIGGAFLTPSIINVIMYRSITKRVAHTVLDKEAVRYGIHLGIQGIPSTIAYWIDGILLYTFLGPQALAIYSFAIAPVEQIKSRLGSVADISLPKIASIDNHSSAYRKQLIHKTLRASGITIFIVAAYIITAPFLFKVLFPRYNASMIYSQAFSLSLVLFPLSILSSALIAEGNTQKNYIYNVTGPVVQIGILLALIPWWGLWGAIIGRIVGRFVNYGLLVGLYRRTSRKIDTNSQVVV